jgi:peptidoglycan/xylan/chitin deacetylase (PgdA/CDA1 family)
VTTTKIALHRAVAVVLGVTVGLLAGCSSVQHPPKVRPRPAPSGASGSFTGARTDALPGATAPGTVPTVIFHGPRDRHRIALTFDSNMTDAMLQKLADGRVRSYANVAVVDELQRMHVPATFFLAGKWIQAYPALTRRLAADPSFELASHSWAHEGFTAKCYGLGSLPPARMAADVETSFQVLDQYTDRPTRYFRFPGGCYDPAALRAIAPAGCSVVEYDDVGGDPFNPDAAAIARATLTQARNGSIVVLHITLANSPVTDKALPAIVAGLRGKGYELVTLSTLLADA